MIRTRPHAALTFAILLCLPGGLRPSIFPERAMVPELSESGVPLTQIDVLSRLFVTAQDRLKAIVLHPPGKTADAREFSSARAADQLRQIETYIAGLRHGSASWIGTHLPIAYADGIRRAETQARAIGVRPEASPLSGSLNQVDGGTARVFAREIYADLNKAATSMGERAGRVLRQTRQMGLGESEIDKILAGGVITGTPVEATKALKGELRRVHGDEVQIIDKNGDPMNFKVGDYAKLVAVTRTREATVHARHDRLAGMGIDLVAVIGRVSRHFCTAYLGQVFSISGKSEKYPALAQLPGGGPPFHPRCSKSTRPYIEDLATAKQQELAEGDDDQDKMLGISATEAQRIFKDLQIEARVKGQYLPSASTLHGKNSA